MENVPLADWGAPNPLADWDAPVPLDDWDAPVVAANTDPTEFSVGREEVSVDSKEPVVRSEDAKVPLGKDVEVSLEVSLVEGGVVELSFPVFAVAAVPSLATNASSCAPGWKPQLGLL